MLELLLLGDVFPSELIGRIIRLDLPRNPGHRSTNLHTPQPLIDCAAGLVEGDWGDQAQRHLFNVQPPPRFRSPITSRVKPSLVLPARSKSANMRR